MCEKGINEESEVGRVRRKSATVSYELQSCTRKVCSARVWASALACGETQASLGLQVRLG